MTISGYFRHGDYPGVTRADRDASHRRLARLERESLNLTPGDALALAVTLLGRIDDAGADYADFQAAQATGREVRKAVRALRRVS